MRNLVASLALAVAALGATAAPLGCVPGVQPGFAPSPPPPAGPALIATAVLGADDPGQAEVTIEGRDLGPLFGLSFHVTASTGSLADARTTDALPLDRVLARVDESETSVAFGGTRLDPAEGDVTVDDGALAAVRVKANEAGDIELRIERAVVRKADGSFVPVAVAGGTLTLEAAP